MGSPNKQKLLLFLVGTFLLMGARIIDANDGPVVLEILLIALSLVALIALLRRAKRLPLESALVR
jgi:hypothetical protein